jgi:hypothetical protein
MSKFSEWIVTRDYPLYFEIIGKVNLNLVIIHKAFRFVTGIWFTLHNGKALEAATLIDRKYQNDMINLFESVCKFLGWTL